MTITSLLLFSIKNQFFTKSEIILKEVPLPKPVSLDVPFRSTFLRPGGIHTKIIFRQVLYVQWWATFGQSRLFYFSGHFASSFCKSLIRFVFSEINGPVWMSIVSNERRSIREIIVRRNAEQRSCCRAVFRHWILVLWSSAEKIVKTTEIGRSIIASVKHWAMWLIGVVFADRRRRLGRKSEMPHNETVKIDILETVNLDFETRMYFLNWMLL